MSEARGGGREELPHVKGALAAWVQEGLGSAWLTLAYVSVGWLGALFHFSLLILLGAESCPAFYGHG